MDRSARTAVRHEAGSRLEQLDAPPRGQTRQVVGPAGVVSEDAKCPLDFQNLRSGQMELRTRPRRGNADATCNPVGEMADRDHVQRGPVALPQRFEIVGCEQGRARRTTRQEQRRPYQFSTVNSLIIPCAFMVRYGCSGWGVRQTRATSSSSGTGFSVTR